MKAPAVVGGLVGDARSVTHDAAVAYAERGWPILPCLPRLKVPATRNGLKAATSDEATIHGWWSDCPDYNVATIGLPDTLVIDVDVSRDASRPLAERISEAQALADLLEVRFPELAAGPRVATPSGGVHLFTRLPAGTPSLPAGPWPRGAVAHHGELRLMGKSYVLLPPSITAAGQYRWVRR